jgi:hypothetical protein
VTTIYPISESSKINFPHFGLTHATSRGFCANAHFIYIQRDIFSTKRLYYLAQNFTSGRSLAEVKPRLKENKKLTTVIFL